jgi:putative tryptophan/tyrosine transport system substrate-binding protein
MPVGQTNRRAFIAGLGGVAAWPSRTYAETRSEVRRIAVWVAATEQGRSNPATIKRRLEELGWAEGRNLHIIVRGWSGDAGAMRSQAEELLASQPEVVVVVSNPALAILKPIAGSVPIVFAMVADPVGSGFIANLAHPGGNITGFTNFEPSMGGKWLELLKEAAPNITRVLALMHPETPVHTALWQTIKASAATLNMEATASGVHDAAEIERAISDFAAAPNGGVIALPHVVTEVHSDLIIALAKQNRLPSIFAFPNHASAGALIAYGVDQNDLIRRTADYVDRILRGAKPSDLPVQAPNIFDLTINLATAKALDLTIPPSLLARADKVIE